MRRELVAPPAGDALEHGFQAGVLERLDFPAVVAHEMVVMVARGIRALETSDAVPEVDPLREPTLDEAFHRPVDARYADPSSFAAQAVVPDMRARRAGSIINLGSISWMIKQGGMPVYTTSKAAIQGLTRSLARDLGPQGIRVNTLVPGWVMTERQLRLWVNEQTSKQIDEQQCLPSRLEPADIARMALFLAADDSRMCTAQDFVVDGGWS